jgi:hypothetical protein
MMGVEGAMRTKEDIQNHLAGIPRELPRQADAETGRLGSPSMKQRGEMLDAASELAAELETARRKAGLPPSQPAPWPDSTWEFLRKHAAKFHNP